ncbi:MAG: 50S ribosomal protein L25 [Deltaproteobacteria bacterium]|nr:50S ribosomal protein L25 [Deltaproteobacteria bacterium]
MTQITLSARTRTDTGKGAARKLRKENRIPGIFYGPKVEPTMVAVAYSDLQGIVKETRGENIVLELRIESDKGPDSHMVMLKELQTDPVKDTFLHVDFHEISMDKEITADIPIELIHTPVGVTKGGILQHVRREVTITCLPGKLVNHLAVDVSALDIGQSVHIRDIDFPDGISAAEEGSLTIATVLAPAVTAQALEEEAEEEALEAAEGGAESGGE